MSCRGLGSTVDAVEPRGAHCLLRIRTKGPEQRLRKRFSPLVPPIGREGRPPPDLYALVRRGLAALPTLPRRFGTTAQIAGDANTKKTKEIAIRAWNGLEPVWDLLGFLGIV